MDDLEAFKAGFKAGWLASGEGFNGEYPDEGKPWEETLGYREMIEHISKMD